MTFPRVEGYVVVSKIGSGSYSTVYKAYTKTGRRSVCVIKCVQKSRVKSTAGGVDKLLTEIKLLKALRHPYIVLMHDFLWDSQNIYIVLEHCATDLNAFLSRHGRLAERSTLYLLQQLASALQFLWERGIAHMDLKPHNLLLSRSAHGRYTLKLADFGFAQYMSEDSKLNEVRGSPLYMAPEMLRDVSYGPKADLWSVGVIMYECLFGEAPYSSDTLQQLIEKITSGQPIQFPGDVPVSAGCADLLRRLLQPDPRLRVSHHEFFRHEYLDLQHMPSPGNYQKAVRLLREAVSSDAAGYREVALDKYCDSLRYLVPIVRTETDPARKKTLAGRVAQYMERAEQLSRALAGGSNSGKDSTNSVACSCEKVEMSKDNKIQYNKNCSCKNTTKSTTQALNRQNKMMRQDSVRQNEGKYIEWNTVGRNIVVEEEKSAGPSRQSAPSVDRATSVSRTDAKADQPAPCEEATEVQPEEKRNRLSLERAQEMCKIQ